MGLKINKKVIYEVDHEDFNEFVKEKYGGDFEIVAYQELNNGSVFNVSVPNVSMAFGNEKQRIRSGDYPLNSTHKIVNCLFEDGHLEKGELSITVSW